MSEERPVSTRRALLGHLWAMVQTRAAAAALVVRLQRTALLQGAVMYGVAAIAALSFLTAVIVLIAVAAPPEWRAPALGAVALVLLATAVFAAVAGGRKLKGDAGLVEDFTRGLKLDLAMLSLAMKGSANTEDAEKLAERERAKTAVREAAVEKAAAPSTAEGGGAASADGPSIATASAAMRAAAPGDSAATARDGTSPADVAAAARARKDAGDRDERGATAGGAYAGPVTGAGDAPGAGVTERERQVPPVTTPEPPPADREQKYGSA